MSSSTVPAARFRGLDDARVVELKVCARPLPLDGQSIVGRLPGVQGIYVAVTHSGVTLAAHLSPPHHRRPDHKNPTRRTNPVHPRSPHLGFTFRMASQPHNRCRLAMCSQVGRRTDAEYITGHSSTSSHIFPFSPVDRGRAASHGRPRRAAETDIDTSAASAPGHEAWMPRSCRSTCMVAASTSYEAQRGAEIGHGQDRARPRNREVSHVTAPPAPNPALPDPTPRRHSAPPGAAAQATLMWSAVSAAARVRIAQNESRPGSRGARSASRPCCRAGPACGSGTGRSRPRAGCAPPAASGCRSARTAVRGTRRWR